MIQTLVIIDDDPVITEMLKEMAAGELKVTAASFCTAEEFFSSERKIPHCVYVVDWNLPGKIQGPEIIRRIRTQDQISPIFMISGNNDKNDILAGLNAGADDYLIKPFMGEELLAKIRNASLRTKAISENMINMGLKMIPEAALIIKDGKRVALTAREFQVFKALFEAQGKVHTRTKIIEMFDDHETTERNIDVLVFSLRKKISVLGLEIETVRGQGYKLCAH